MTISSRVAGACLTFAALCHLSWLTEFVSGSRLPVRTSYVSELFALGQPWSQWLRFGDVLAGTAVLVAAILLLSARLRDRRARLLEPGAVGLLGLGLFGAGTITDALLPMACTPSVSAACAAAEKAGTVPLHHQLHTVSSSVATTGAVAGFLLLGWVLARSRPPSRALMVAAIGYALLTGWVLLEVAEFGASMLGWSQRLQIVGSSVCLALLSIACWTGRIGVRP
ncbi:DUF998 domain-containing protein [Enemella sp. A6]|uniref:DUF998 domain-containing protein n=1 Tax=Enemella sp. A6 TaxID=3440152 RepID=UPI003EC0BC5C